MGNYGGDQMKMKSALLGCSLLLGFLLLVGFSSKAEAEQVETSTAPIKKVALTFDDGPDKKYTDLILDILKDKEVKATFFVVGKQVELFPATMKRIAQEGHAIGNHSWDHKNFTKLSSKQIKQQLDRTNQAIEDAIGESTAWVRAPYGAKNNKVKSTISKSGNTEIGWTVDTRDWAGTSKEEMMANVKKNLKPDGIILMHSLGGKGGKLDNTVEFLPELIDYLLEQNYTLVTIPELYEKE
jgi:peptidoglycan-N-acetylglucosamine deacetylase